MLVMVVALMVGGCGSSNNTAAPVTHKYTISLTIVDHPLALNEVDPFVLEQQKMESDGLTGITPFGRVYEVHATDDAFNRYLDNGLWSTIWFENGTQINRFSATQPK